MRQLRARWVAGAFVAGAAVVAAVAVPVTVVGSVQDPAPSDCGSGAPHLTVQGTGTATGTPDLLTLDLGVAVSGGDAHAALAADDATTGDVLAALENGGVAVNDVQTTGPSLQPQYARTGVLTGYSVTQSVVVKLRDLSTAGSVIDAAAAAGGNATRIDSMSFSLADPRPLEDQARQDAVRQAASHAGAMAAAAGERLGAVCSLTDHSSSNPVRASVGFASNSAASGVPLQAGTQQATAQVTLVYALAASRSTG